MGRSRHPNVGAHWRRLAAPSKAPGAPAQRPLTQNDAFVGSNACWTASAHLNTRSPQRYCPIALSGRAWCAPMPTAARQPPGVRCHTCRTVPRPLCVFPLFSP
jgi:hypothetical protein